MRKSALGVLVAALLACAALAPAASAAKQFAAPGKPTAGFVADQVAAENHVFSLDGGELKCTTAVFEVGQAEFLMPATTLKLHPTYSGCKAFGFLNATFDTTGCDFVLAASGQFDVVCAPGKQILVKASTCEVAIPPQSIPSGLTYVNAGGSPATVLLELRLLSLKMNKLKDGFLCTLSGTGEATGALAGDSVLKGFNGGNQVGIKVE